MLRTLKQLKNIRAKRILLRVDFNVPIDKRGVSDDTRIRETLPTINYLLKKKAKVIVVTHLGRPEGKVVERLKLTAVSQRLAKLLGKRVKKLNHCVGKTVEAEVKKMKEGEVILLENIRFHPEEETAEKNFTKQLARLGDIFVNDAFAACHRNHASTAGLGNYLPAYAGFLIEREIKGLSPLLKNPKKPLTLIIGGAKVDTKIGLLKTYLLKADTILIGGALANTFLAAEGYNIGKSLHEPDKIEAAQEILMLSEKRGVKIVLPEDAVVADSVTEYAKTLDLPIEDIGSTMKILDIGRKTREKFESIVQKSKTVIWNGPLGLYEFSPFSQGTNSLFHAFAQTAKAHKGALPFELFIGGGDTIDALKRSGMGRFIAKSAFISTGGGAMLEFLEGKKLPGIAVLEK